MQVLPLALAAITFITAPCAAHGRPLASADEPTREHEAEQAERWALYGVFVPGRIVREAPPGRRPAQTPIVVATSGGALFGVAGRF
jgi:hypothetical protein